MSKHRWSPASTKNRQRKKTSVARLLLLVKDFPCRSAQWYADTLRFPMPTVAGWLRELVEEKKLRTDRGGWEIL